MLLKKLSKLVKLRMVASRLQLMHKYLIQRLMWNQMKKLKKAVVLHLHRHLFLSKYQNK